MSMCLCGNPNSYLPVTCVKPCHPLWLDDKENEYLLFRPSETAFPAIFALFYAKYLIVSQKCFAKVLFVIFLQILQLIVINVYLFSVHVSNIGDW